MGAFFFCKNNDAVLTAVYINKKNGGGDMIWKNTS